MLTFKKIIKEEIFDDCFKNLNDDNEVEFSRNGISVIYAPNGTGKSSLAHVLGRGKGTEYEVVWKDQVLTNKDSSDYFHIINDQNSRNIIEGSTEDFILGDDIRREYFLKGEIESGFKNLFGGLAATLKNEFGIDKKGAPVLDYIDGDKVKEYVSDLANNKSKGSNIERRGFIDRVSGFVEQEIPEYSESELYFVVQDLNSKGSVINEIYKILHENTVVSPALVTVEKSNDAIEILEKYSDLRECVVCDSEIEPELLRDKKIENRQAFIDEIDASTRIIFDEMEARSSKDDPLGIRRHVMESSVSGSLAPIGDLIEKIQHCFSVISKKINNLFSSCLDNSYLVDQFIEYEALTKEKPELTEEDVLFIREFVNDCIEKDIYLERDMEGNLKLLLGGETFLDKERSKLGLSNGEQNFISIAFELLKAQKSDADIVVLDDPISSFDSIFKNKIIYAISKFLEHKNQLILTHSLDLVKLLEHQKKNSFNLYILNNVSGDMNGFLAVSSHEKELMLYLNCLVDFFRGEVRNYIKDEWGFLVSLVPFMRTFSRIVNKPGVTESMTSIMHGYNGSAATELSSSYKELFGGEFLGDNYEVSVDGILSADVSAIEVIDANTFPVLNRALVHVLNYLWLRLKVERELVLKYGINTKQHDQLSSIIIQAFKGQDSQSIKNRVFLLSRKTLLNDFNHFEQDLSVFQPALDITDNSLKKEKEDIESFLSKL